VILFPDADAYSCWSEKAAALRKILPQLKVSELLENNLTEAEKADGYDLADFLLSDWLELELLDAEDWFEERIAIKHFDGGMALPLAVVQAKAEFQERKRKEFYEIAGK
jgi:hypothetical protein